MLLKNALGVIGFAIGEAVLALLLAGRRRLTGEHHNRIAMPPTQSMPTLHLLAGRVDATTDLSRDIAIRRSADLPAGLRPADRR
jgi:hypothetical protein